MKKLTSFFKLDIRDPSYSFSVETILVCFWFVITCLVFSYLRNYYFEDSFIVRVILYNVVNQKNHVMDGLKIS